MGEKAATALAKYGKDKSVKGLLNYSQKIRAERELNIKRSMEKGIADFGALTERDVYCIGLGLYWGEGYKKGSQELGFTNSDPKMIQFYIHWLERVFKINRAELILRVSINGIHKYRIKDVEKQWSQVTGIPLSQFTKSSLIKTDSKKVYGNMETHLGTLRIKVRKGTTLRREILGSLEGIVQQL